MSRPAGASSGRSGRGPNWLWGQSSFSPLWVHLPPLLLQPHTQGTPALGMRPGVQEARRIQYRLLLLLCFYSNTSSRRISVYQLFLARYHFETNLGQGFPQSNRKTWQMLTIRRTHTLFLLPSPPDLKSFQLPSSVRVVAGVAPARTSELSVTLTLVRSCECQ